MSHEGTRLIVSDNCEIKMQDDTRLVGVAYDCHELEMIETSSHKVFLRKLIYDDPYIPFSSRVCFVFE